MTRIAVEFDEKLLFDARKFFVVKHFQLNEEYNFYKYFLDFNVRVRYFLIEHNLVNSCNVKFFYDLMNIVI